MSETIKIYCDGACKGNPGKSGSGLSIYQKDKAPTLLYGEYNERGTNNTAELNALFKALLIASKSEDAIIYSDSKYSIDCITKWAYSWKKNGWTKKGGEIKNLDIIKLSHYLYEEIKENTKVEYVKAHTGIEGNELADRMAMVAISCQNKAYQEYKYSSISSVLKI
jgi:ribonuclease HI